MARLKPSGIRLRVWRALRDSERQEALDLNADPDRQLSTLRRLTQQAAHRPLPSSPVPGAMRFVEHQLPPPRLARSKRHALGKMLPSSPALSRRCCPSSRLTRPPVLSPVCSRRPRGLVARGPDHCQWPSIQHLDTTLRPGRDEQSRCAARRTGSAILVTVKSARLEHSFRKREA